MSLPADKIPKHSQMATVHCYDLHFIHVLYITVTEDNFPRLLPLGASQQPLIKCWERFSRGNPRNTFQDCQRNLKFQRHKFLNRDFLSCPLENFPKEWFRCSPNRAGTGVLMASRTIFATSCPQFHENSTNTQMYHNNTPNISAPGNKQNSTKNLRKSKSN